METTKSIEETVHKLVPPILLACIFALTQAYILTGQNKDTITRLTTTDKKQWDIIASLKTEVATLKEQQKHNLTKEEYYKDRR